MSCSRMWDSLRSRWPPGPLAAWLVMSVPAFFILPALDDWFTARPNHALTWSSFQPGALYRPLEEVLLWLAGAALPSFGVSGYVFLLHLVVVAGHGISGWCVCKLLLRWCPPGASVCGTIIFLLSPAQAASVWSLDSAIQTMSTAFGLLASLALMTHRRGGLMWLVLSCIALGWKESGASWFIAAPLLYAIDRAAVAGETRDATPLMKSYVAKLLALGCLALVAYACFRVLASPAGNLGMATGRYSTHFNPLHLASNAAMLAGVALTTADTLGILSDARHWTGAMLSLLLGLPLMLLALSKHLRVERPQTSLLWLLTVAALLGPHIVIRHVSEMYAHPVVAGVVLALTPRQSPGDRRAAWSWAMGLFLCGSCWTLTSKFSAMRATSVGAKEVAARVAAAYPHPSQRPHEVCIVRDSARSRAYSVFLAEPGRASQWGLAVWGEWSWQLPAKYRWVDSLEQCPPSVETWEVSLDGVVRVRHRTDSEHIPREMRLPSRTEPGID